MIVRGSCGICAIASRQLAPGGLPNRRSSQSTFATSRLVEVSKSGRRRFSMAVELSVGPETFMDGLSDEGRTREIEPSELSGEGRTNDPAKPELRLQNAR